MARNITKVGFNVPKLPSKKRACAYARVSSGKDAMLHSLSAQVSFYSEYIQKQSGFEYCGVYADEALTGTSANRAEFQRMLTDCRSGKIDMIITKSISRFARNTLTMLETVRELKALGIDVYFEKENINTNSGDGELMLTILASFAQEESLSVSENCKWRIRKRFEQGELVSLRFMYGYTISKNIIEINEEQAKIIRMIFTDYINGMGCSLIAKKLRNMNVEKLRGGIWLSNRIADILKNEKYAGNALLQKKYVSNHLTKTLVQNKGELPKYYAQGTHPAIVTIEIFEKAQEIMRKGKSENAAKTPNGSYPFTGKIRCGNCGKNYKRKSNKSKISWNCPTYLELGKSFCHTKQIPEDILIAITTEVLDLSDFNEKIKEIIVPEFNKLIFVFYDGKTIEKTWKDKSRRDSWNETNKQLAREQSMGRNNK